MRLKNIDNLVKKMQTRMDRLISMRDDMLGIDAKNVTPRQKVDLALRYEALSTRIDELTRWIDALIDAINLDRTVWDRRQLESDRRGSKTRRGGIKT